MLNKARFVLFGHVCENTKFRFAISDRSCKRILLKCNPKQPKTINYNISKFEENWSPNTDVNGFIQNGRHDVIELQFSKSEKHGTGEHPREYMC